MRQLILTIAILMAAIFSHAQCKFEFKIGGKSYNATEELLNNSFGQIFQELKATRRVKDKDFDLWVGSYSIYKSLACNGVYQWEVFYNKIGNIGYYGDASKRDLGLDENNKSAGGNINKADNLAARMALLNNMMAIKLTNNFLNTTLK